MGRKIKVCVLTTSYPRYKGDSKGIFIEKLVKNLAYNNISIKLITPNNKYKNIMGDSGFLYNIKSNFMAKIELIPCIAEFFLNSIITAKNCDLIHANWIFSGIPGLIAKKLYKKPLLITVRGGEIHEIKTDSLIYKLWKYILKRTDVIVCVSNEIKQKIKKLVNKETQIIMNGIDYNIFKQTNKKEARKELKLRKDKIILIYVGRLIKIKGPDILLEAFKKIKNSNLQLIYIGEGSMKEKLSQLSKLDNRVTFLGNINHELIPKYLTASDIFIFPSIHEAGGNSLLEAASCGMPIIGTNEGFVKDILNYKGVVLTEKNSEDIKKAIEILITNKKLRKNLGKEARKKIIEYGVSWEDNAKKYIKLYKKMLEKNKTLKSRYSCLSQ